MTDDEQAVGGVTLTQTERRTIGCDCWHIVGVWHHVRFCKAPAVERILTAHRDAAEAERTALVERVEAVAAVANRWQDVLTECKQTNPRWILDQSVMALDTALRELLVALKGGA